MFLPIYLSVLAALHFIGGLCRAVNVGNGQPSVPAQPPKGGTAIILVLDATLDSTVIGLAAWRLWPTK